ncbi:unnamed protein product [Rotaria sp. Silwood2]|nr:unnamed protein product [Rotaria sp. Silwood2]
MSSSTTKNFREVMAELLSDENIRDVPSIGGVLGAKLSEAGYEKKFRDFTGELLKDKHVSEVPGLGPKLSSNLAESGITKVCL